MNTCSQLIPSDVCKRFQNSYILNANTLTQQYLRRMYNISAGMPLLICGQLSSTIVCQEQYFQMQWKLALLSLTYYNTYLKHVFRLLNILVWKQRRIHILSPHYHNSISGERDQDNVPGCYHEAGP